MLRLSNLVVGATTSGAERTGILRIRVGHGGVRSYGVGLARIRGVLGVQPILL